MTESGRKFIETYKKESKAKAEADAAAAGDRPEVNIAKIQEEPDNQQKDGGEKDTVSTTWHLYFH